MEGAKASITRGDPLAQFLVMGQEAARAQFVSEIPSEGTTLQPLVEYWALPLYPVPFRPVIDVPIVIDSADQRGILGLSNLLSRIAQSIKCP